ncbi:unnamed protein product [Polarella glacialis]|uniref:NAD(P)(+)--arginine ADP-ribosyltransferase n=1 Tax=Polarella glacialis TaxID=89957 RepID=A0A813EKN0_POLGL|nr:unnamed protein product [Polarella glacialis]
MSNKEPIQQPESSVPLRLLLAAEPFISAVPSATWEELRPVRHLLEELRTNPGIRAACPDIEEIASDIEFKAGHLHHDEEAFRFTQQMDQDCLQAILACTHDTGQAQGSLFFELNNCLRERSLEGRAGLMRTWGDFMHYFLKGLSKLEPASGVVYRGLPEKDAVIAQYKLGRPIQWGAFSSTSRAKEVAKKSFAGDKHSAIILKITITSGRRLGPLSFFPKEDEILLSPRCRFVAWLQLVLCLIVCIFFFRFVHFFICLCFLNFCLSPTCI